jgi:hypothetical protein
MRNGRELFQTGFGIFPRFRSRISPCDFPLSQPYYIDKQRGILYIVPIYHI